MEEQLSKDASDTLPESKGWCGWKSWFAAILSSLLLYLVIMFAPKVVSVAPVKKPSFGLRWIGVSLLAALGLVCASYFALRSDSVPSYDTGVAKSSPVSGLLGSKPAAVVMVGFWHWKYTILCIVCILVLTAFLRYYCKSDRKPKIIHAPVPNRESEKVDLEAGKRPRNFLGFWPGSRRRPSRRSFGVSHSAKPSFSIPRSREQHPDPESSLSRSYNNFELSAQGSDLEIPDLA